METNKITAKFVKLSPNGTKVYDIRINTNSIPVALRAIEIQTNSKLQMILCHGKDDMRVYFSENKRDGKPWKIICQSIAVYSSHIGFKACDETSFARIESAYVASGYTE